MRSNQQRLVWRDTKSSLDPCFRIYTFVYIRKIYIKHNAHFWLKFKNKLRTIPVSANEQYLKLSI